MILVKALTEQALFLDIETSGLHKQKDTIISIGILFFDPQKQPIMKHWFLEKKEEEKSLLESFLLFLSSYHTIYTYNGKGFDYPFLLSRMQYYHLDTTPLLSFKLIDFKEYLKHFSRTRMTLEKMLNFKRQSSTSGKDVIKLYRTYIDSHHMIYSDLIIRHQEDELRSLLAFYELYDMLFNFSNLKHLESKEIADTLTLTLQASTPFTYSFNGSAFDLHFSYQEGHDLLHLTLPLIHTSLRHYLEPCKDYYYIESQGQLMHKSLAQFIPTSLRRRATKEECSVIKSSCYLKIYTTYKLTASLWYDTNKEVYIELIDFSPDLLSTQIFCLFFRRDSKQNSKPSTL